MNSKLEKAAIPGAAFPTEQAQPPRFKTGIRMAKEVSI